MSWKSIAVGSYACPDEVILSTLLVYGRGFSSGEKISICRLRHTHFLLLVHRQ